MPYCLKHQVWSLGGTLSLLRVYENVDIFVLKMLTILYDSLKRDPEYAYISIHSDGYGLKVITK